MSADVHHAAAAGHGHHDAHSAGGHGTFQSYMTGFVLSVILTVIPFWLVMGNVLDNSLVTTLVILALGGVQMVVHVIYFLHMSTKSEGGWTFMALIFTITLVVIMLAGSVWVMYHLNHNMMPMDAHDVMNNAR
ncbi:MULTISPECIES: cytochrome o ubiquinol oxidase subunit IV [unclassified Methylobacterium]|jgi:cytochrome o ubiquinol oxidase subunit IV|uniref:cytochrome o ubiquinol oxidase subunit IV n=1 Tax=unclassified Methylobacterium TaxID=2615210 RepID=UPI001354AC14|nr:cytochrome o ubiquinol oxidase subunit IV [Methylobacterium sp. 2A]MWV20450.1 cytochrome o ubiquinol oxidase subunit IV [Methylobacterium sp. 2A]